MLDNELTDIAWSMAVSDQKPLTTLTQSLESKTFYSGDSAGLLRSWDKAGCSPISSCHSNLVISATHDGSSLISIGMDDEIRIRAGEDAAK